MRLQVTIAAGCSVLAVVACAGGGESDDSGTHDPTTATVDMVTTPALPTAVPAADVLTIALEDVETARLRLRFPDWLTTAAGSLWVKLDGGTVVRVDPDTALVEQRIAAGGPDKFSFCQGFGTSGDAVWACSPYGTLQRIDARAGRVTDRLTTTPRADQGHLVTADGRLWLIEPDGDSIVGLDVGDNTVGEPIELGAGCTDLAAATGSTVWAVCPVDGLLLEVDVRAGRVTRRVSIPGPRQLAIRDDRLWVGFERGVAQLDLQSLKVDAVYDVQPGISGSIWAGDGLAWVRCEQGPFLLGIDPDARQVVVAVTAPSLPSGGSVQGFGDELWASAYDDFTLVRLRPPV